MRVDSSVLPKDNWHHYLRERDLLQLLSSPPVQMVGPALEIGSGDGLSTKHLIKNFGDVVPTDVRPRRTAAVLCLADAQKLPFRGDQFNFVFSSNVLEHIPDLKACLSELRRVTLPDAVMLHTMPTPVWKLLQFAAFPVELARRLVLPRVLRQKRVAFSAGIQCNIEEQEIKRVQLRHRPLGIRLCRAIWPAVHGVSQSHLSEIAAFSVSRWTKIFEDNGFEVIRTDRLFFHSPYRIAPYQGLWLRELLGRSGIASVHGYWTRKA